MRTHGLLLAALAASVAIARADVSLDSSASLPAAAPSPAPVAAAPADSPKIADFKRRFAEGKALETQGKLTEALAIFDGILAEAPDAKGSLQEAGRISVELNDYAKADGYFTKLHALVPDYPPAIEALIPISQALKHDAKVEILIHKFQELYASGKLKEFQEAYAPGQPLEPYFVRERIHLEDGTEIVIVQFFDYHQPRFYAWAAELRDANHALKRRLTVNYDPEVTKSLRAKDPRFANAEQFLLVEDIMSGEHVTRLDVYQQFLALPDYLKMRNVMFQVFANALKPIDSAPVPQAAP